MVFSLWISQRFDLVNGFFYCQNLKMAISHTPFTPEFPRSSKQSRQHLEWSSTTMKEIYSISSFHKMVICRIQFQLSAAVGTKLKDIPVTQSHDVSTATCSHIVKWPKFQRRSRASCFKPPRPCLFSYLLYIQGIQYPFAYADTTVFEVPLQKWNMELVKIWGGKCN